MKDVPPVPPPPTFSVPVSVGVKVNVPEELIMVWPSVRPLKESAEEVARVSAPLLVVTPPAETEVMVPAFCVMQAPLYERQPFVRSMPLAKVEEAVVEVTLSSVVVSPAPKVEVAWPKMVLVARPLATERTVVEAPPLNASRVEVALLGNRYPKPPAAHDCVVTSPNALMVRHWPDCAERFVMARDVVVALVVVEWVATKLVTVS